MQASQASMSGSELIKADQFAVEWDARYQRRLAADFAPAVGRSDDGDAGLLRPRRPVLQGSDSTGGDADGRGRAEVSQRLRREGTPRLSVGEQGVDGGALHRADRHGRHRAEFGPRRRGEVARSRGEIARSRVSPGRETGGRRGYREAAAARRPQRLDLRRGSSRSAAARPRSTPPRSTRWASGS